MRRTAIRKNAYKLGREMVWSNVAGLYLRSFELARLERAVLSRKSFATKTLDEQPRALPDCKLEHLSRMTDSTGLFQHAIFTVPNFSEGYCTDDNARGFHPRGAVGRNGGGTGAGANAGYRPMRRFCTMPSTRISSGFTIISALTAGGWTSRARKIRTAGRSGRWAWAWDARLTAAFR